MQDVRQIRYKSLKMRERNTYVLCNQVLFFALSVWLEVIMLQRSEYFIEV